MDDWGLTPTTAEFAGRLLDQQFWCWGRDIGRPFGNGLLLLGCERDRPPAGVEASTAYRLAMAGGGVTLWGWGIVWVAPDDGAVLLRRGGFAPRWRPRSDLPRAVWSPHQLPSFRAPRRRPEWLRARWAWSALLGWIADYETWALANLGLEHRQHALDAWKKPAVAAAEAMPEIWRCLQAAMANPNTTMSLSSALAPLALASAPS